MSRRSRKRSGASESQRSKRRAGGIKWVWRIAFILAFGIVLSGFGLYFWMQSYLRSDDFRVFVGESVGGLIGSKATFEKFEWEGLDVRSGGMIADGDGVVRGIKADGVQAQVSLAGVKRGVWEISDLRISQLSLDVRSPSVGVDQSREEEDKSTSEGEEKKDDRGGFLSGLLPDRAELMSAEVMSMDLNFQSTSGGFVANDVGMRVDGGKVAGNYALQLSGGTITTPWFGSPLDLASARVKYKTGRFYISDSQFQVYKHGHFTLTGEIEGGEFGFFCTLKEVGVRELLSNAWKKRISGDIETKMKISNRSGHILTRGEVKLKNGVITGLPVLDRIAAYANTPRFRRLNLSEAQMTFWKEEGRLELTDIVLASEGLVRLEGTLTIVNGRLDGRFQVGITPGTLAHIPGAETKVFVRGNQGLLWSPLRITGTVDAPKEDLSDRMIAAAGERMFEIIPETGMKVLKFAHTTATELPKKAVEAGVDVIREGSGVIQEGVRGVFDLLPGGSSEE